MDIILISLITLAVIAFVLAVINAFLLWYFHQTNKKIDRLLEKGKIKNFKDVFLSLKQKNEDLEEEIKKAFLKIKDLEDTCQTTIRKIGMVRFNPFNDVGGNQSFALAMMDNKNNGFVISSFFTKEGNRVYAKTIKNGESDHTLSEEEKEAIKRAIGSE